MLSHDRGKVRITQPRAPPPQVVAPQSRAHWLRRLQPRPAPEARTRVTAHRANGEWAREGAGPGGEVGVATGTG